MYDSVSVEIDARTEQVEELSLEFGKGAFSFSFPSSSDHIDDKARYTTLRGWPELDQWSFNLGRQEVQLLRAGQVGRRQRVKAFSPA